MLAKIALGLVLCLGIAAAIPGNGVAATNKCCTNCTKTSCNTCNSPSTNPITKQAQCDALATKATCDDKGKNCTPGGWLKKQPALKTR
jgi:hypothetical protein